MMPTSIFRSALALLLAPTLMRAQAPDTLAARPIPLREAVTLAQQNGLAAIQAHGQVRNAESSVRAARAALFPSLNFTMGQVNQPPQAAGLMAGRYQLAIAGPGMGNFMTDTVTGDCWNQTTPGEWKSMGNPRLQKEAR